MFTGGHVPQPKIQMLSFKQITIVDRCAPTPAGLSASCPPGLHTWHVGRFQVPIFQEGNHLFFFVGFWREYDVHKFSPNSPERNGWIVLKYVESFYTHTPIYEHLRAQTRARISQIYPYFTHLCEKQTVQRCAHPHVYRGVYIYIQMYYIYVYIYTVVFLS